MTSDKVYALEISKTNVYAHLDVLDELGKEWKRRIAKAERYKTLKGNFYKRIQVLELSVILIYVHVLWF